MRRRRDVPSPHHWLGNGRKDRCAGGEMEAGGGTRSYSRRAAGPAPSVPHLRGKARPLWEVHARNCARGRAARTSAALVHQERSRATFERSNISASPNIRRLSAATGGVPRLEEGTSGRNHCTARVGNGSSPTTSSSPAYSPSSLSSSEPGARGRHVPASANSLPAYSAALRESAATTRVETFV
jgi:hypothetical protein